MSESQTWADFRPVVKYLDPQRIEDRVSLGIPDVDLAIGNIELKFLAEWPKRPGTLIRIPHFTPEQRGWLIRRCQACRLAGLRINAWLLLRVGMVDPNEWLLFNGDVAAACIGTATQAQLRAVAVFRSIGIPGAKILDVLDPRVTRG